MLLEAEKLISSILYESLKRVVGLRPLKPSCSFTDLPAGNNERSDYNFTQKIFSTLPYKPIKVSRIITLGGVLALNKVMNRTVAVNRIRITIAVCFLIALCFVVVSVFWYYEYQYSLPTPKPQHYQDVSAGTVIKLPATLAGDRKKPVLLHFFNPNCPCSRFNIAHFKTLVKRYKNEVNFAVVLMTNKHYDAKALQEALNLDIPILTDNSLAVLCGVYSTPQAALIDKEGRLYFRGNYNQSRYCSDKKTEYARLAIQDLLYSKTAIELNPLAKRAYGCRLPDCAN